MPARRWTRVAIGLSVALHAGLLMTVFWNPDDPAGPVVSLQQQQSDIQVTMARLPPRPPSPPQPDAQPEAAAPPPSVIAPPHPAAPQNRVKPARPTLVHSPAPTRLAEAAPAPEAAAQPAPRESHEPPLVMHPRFRTPPIPATYPPRALELNQQGDVLVRAIITAEGDPVTVNLWRGSGFPMLDQAALDAVRRWRFIPAEIDGVAVTAIVQVPVVFHLK